MAEIIGVVSARANALQLVVARSESQGANSPARCVFFANSQLYEWSAPTGEAMRRRLSAAGGTLAICQHGVEAPPSQNHQLFDGQRLFVAVSGCVDNVRALRRHMAAAGLANAAFTIEQLIASLLAFHLRSKPRYADAACAVLNRLEGRYSFLALFEREPDCLLAASKHGGLQIGYGGGQAIAASDARTKLGADVAGKLERGEVAILRADNIAIIDGEGMHIEKQLTAGPARFV